MNEDNLIKYYNKFNEDKRLTRRHGIIEYTTSMKYIHKYLKKIDNPKIIDIGAGTGKYSCTLYDEGYNITAVELIKHNLMTLKKKNNNIKAYQGNATDLSRFKDNTFDVAILFGPMYHLISEEEKIKAEEEEVIREEDESMAYIPIVKEDLIVSCLLDQNIKMMDAVEDYDEEMPDIEADNKDEEMLDALYEDEEMLDALYEDEEMIDASYEDDDTEMTDVDNDVEYMDTN